MPLIPGQRLGPYEIIAPLGAGGMGEVYRARDPKLKRDVAIKVLPADVAGDHERLARFQREAEVLASLNHPHIAHVYGIEDPSAGSGQAALVMELVEGEDLAQRIARGPIPIDEALPMARQIAEALEAAHDAGIVHRDLKPANIKVRDDGTVKVLDFGLAKALVQDLRTSRPHDLVNSPTITSPAMTMRGVVLGTAAYMAPEQAKGKAVDRRADIWAFGCVLYEMLTGQRTFAGEDVSDTLVSILRDDPRWAALPANTPPHVRLLLRRCLQRDPQKRLPHIGAARLDLADADTGELTKAVAPPVSRWRLAALGGAIAGATIVGAIVFVMRGSPGADTSQVVQFTIQAPAGMTFAGGNAVPRVALSRDGQYILYQTDDTAGSRLWVRPIGAAEPVAVPGSATERGGNSMQQAFWSPDNRFIGFFDEARHELKRLDRTVGMSQVIAPVPGNQFGAAWSSDDTIILATMGTRGIQRVPAAGGPIVQLTKVDTAKHESSHLWPQLFPDDRHFVFLISYSDDTPSALFLGSVDGGAPQRLVSSPASGVATTGNYLIYVRDTSTVAQQVDIGRGTLAGNPILIGGAAASTLLGRAALSVSNTGVLIYSSEDSVGEGNNTKWVDRAGAALPNPPRSVSTSVRAVRLSPDDRLLAYFKPPANPREASFDIWVEDLARGIESKVASVPGNGLSLVFSPDGKEFVTRGISNPNYTLFRQTLFSTAPPRPIFTSENGELLFPFDWTPDGQQLIVSRVIDGINNGGELWTMPVDASAKPVQFMKERARSGMDLSPDGRWLAYTAGIESGRGQVFLQAFPNPGGGNFPVSAIGGSHPRWRRDGRELFFVAGGQLMAVDVSTTPTVVIGQPRPLFDLAQPGQFVAVAGSVYPYDVTSDGRRFVVLETKRAGSTRTLAVITNWMRAFKAE